MTRCIITLTVLTCTRMKVRWCWQSGWYKRSLWCLFHQPVVFQAPQEQTGEGYPTEDTAAPQSGPLANRFQTVKFSLGPLEWQNYITEDSMSGDWVWTQVSHGGTGGWRAGNSCQDLQSLPPVDRDIWTNWLKIQARREPASLSPYPTQRDAHLILLFKIHWWWWLVAISATTKVLTKSKVHPWWRIPAQENDSPDYDLLPLPFKMDLGYDPHLCDATEF